MFVCDVCDVCDLCDVCDVMCVMCVQCVCVSVCVWVCLCEVCVCAYHHLSGNIHHDQHTWQQFSFGV